MKKIIFMVCLLLAASGLFAAALETEADTISDIQEKPAYEKGAYTAGSEGNTGNVKKEEGMDFKVPEILITGQVDTKIMMKREMISLEDLQSVKNILYEKEKIYMPDYYLKEEALTPKALETAPSRDFTGQFKFFGGSYANILADGLIGKAFDRDNQAVLKINHNSFSNGVMNSRETYDNLNSVDLFYLTRYDFLDAAYRATANISTYGNPYTDLSYANVFKKEYTTADISISSNFSGKAGEYDFSGTIGYIYFDALNDAKDKLYKENRTTLAASLDRDIEVYGKKMKLMSSLDCWAAEQLIQGSIQKGVIDLDMLVKAIVNFEPFTLQAGIKVMDYRLTDNNFLAGIYLNANYDIIPDLSLYAIMDPKMQVPDYTLTMPGKYLYPGASVKPGTDLLDLRCGFNWNIANLFVDAYWGYKITDNSLMADENGASRYYVLVNSDLEYSRAGLSVEALKIKNLKLTLAYEYKNIVRSTLTQTYLPNNEFTIKGSYDVSEWNFLLTLKMMSGFNGTSAVKCDSFTSVDASISRKINSLLTVTGYINNVLNNNYYLLYYYKEKNINLGAGATLNF
jgi:hypothetical protein